MLLERGATYDLVITSALGDFDRVQAFLNEDPSRISEAQPCGKRAVSSAVQFGHEPIVRMLLDQGADPNWPEGPNAPRGAALHAAKAGNRPLVELLLAHGARIRTVTSTPPVAPPTSPKPENYAPSYSRTVVCSIPTTWCGWANTMRWRAVYLQTPDRQTPTAVASSQPLAPRASATWWCDCSLPARVPPVVDGCRSYLWSDSVSLRLLLESGMDPDLPNWQHATPLHDLCGRDARGRAREHRVECAAIFLDAGATISAKVEDYRSTPLAWPLAATSLTWSSFCSPVARLQNLPDDEPWATPLAWATKRGHHQIIDHLRAARAMR